MRWLVNLLANKQALQPLIEFLMRTEIRSRKGAAEEDEEWERRNDRKWEETLGG